MGYLVFTKRQTVLWGGFGHSMLGNIEDQKCRVFSWRNESKHLLRSYVPFLLGYSNGQAYRRMEQNTEGAGCRFPSEGGDANRRQQAGGHMTWRRFGQKSDLVLEVLACVLQLPCWHV